MRKEIPLVYRDILELDVQGALSSGKFTVARDLLLQVQTLNTVRRIVSGAVTVADYVHRLEQRQAKGVELLINVSNFKKTLNILWLEVCRHLYFITNFFFYPCSFDFIET